MKTLFLTSNDAVSSPLSNWLAKRGELIEWHEKLDKKTIIDMHPDIVISYSYLHILKAEVLDTLPDRFINLHISFLPYNRGFNPNIWSFLKNTPKGVSIHLMDPGIDTGNILVQKEVTFDESSETIGHSYRVVHKEIETLFYDNWDGLYDGIIKGIPQVGEGSFHYAREFARIKDQLLGEEGWEVPISTLKKRYEHVIAINSSENQPANMGA